MTTYRADYGEALASGLCNMLYPHAHAKTAFGPADTAVGRVGNWVGGMFYCHQDQLIFQMNLMNEPFQNTPNGRLIQYDWIEYVKPGRMLLFAETVDIQTRYGLFRIRTSKSHRGTLYALLPRVKTNR